MFSTCCVVIWTSLVTKDSNRKLICFMGILKEMKPYQLWCIRGDIGKCDVLINVMFCLIWFFCINYNLSMALNLVKCIVFIPGFVLLLLLFTVKLLWYNLYCEKRYINKCDLTWLDLLWNFVSPSLFSWCWPPLRNSVYICLEKVVT